MLKDYIINALILVAFNSIIYQLFRNSGLDRSLAVKFRILSGAIWGLLGITLMAFGVYLPNNLVVDFRNLAVFLSAITGSWASATTSALIISIFRVLAYGVNTPSIVAVVVLVISVIIFCLIALLKIQDKFKWLLSIGISQLMSFIAFSIIIDDIKLLQGIRASYFIGLSIIAFLLYYYTKYMEELTESFRKYKQEAKKDFLTGLNNVRQFDILYNEIIDNIDSNYKEVSLLYIDIDFFKKVNDTFGHKEGDLVLKKLGEILGSTCRNIDIVSRNGGEEFSVILINCNCEMAIEIAERIRKNVESTSIELSDNNKINITVSIGIASYPIPVGDFNLLRERADMALYEAKHTGRNKFAVSY